MNRAIFLAAFLWISVVYAADPEPAIPAETLDEGLPKVTPSKEELESNMHALIQGNNSFAFELYSQLQSAPGNLCFSPYSVTAAIAIPFAGSKGSTQVELRTVMHYLTDTNQVNEIYSILDKLYTTPWYLGPNECRIFLANSIWLQRDIKILPGFLDTITRYYRASVKQIDFLRNTDGARLNINDWVREKTQGRITEEIKKGDIDRNTLMLIISAIYMKAVWSTPFDPSVTREAPFFIDNVTTGTAIMMSTSGKFRTYRTPDFSIIELPYRPSFEKKPTLSMMIVLPKSNFGLAQVEQKFYSEQWNTWLVNMREEAVIVSIPKFSVRQSFDLSSILKRMGLNLVFRSDLADFSGMSESGNLSFSAVVHESSLSIDEKGSDVISANPIEITKGPELGAASVITADHPFLFLIVDTTNNMILFMGRIMRPT